MADNVDLATPTGNAATDERSINSATVHVPRVGEIGATGYATGQVTPTTTAGTLLAARETRKYVVFRNRGTQDVFIGPATVTTANGFALVPGGAITLYLTALVQCIIASGTATSYVDYIEVYDT